MKEIIKILKEKNKEIFEEVRELRREIHKYPELAFEEYKTSELVYNYLKSLGLNPRRGVAKTGVIAYISGDREGKTIALRADMDALPITEENDVPYKSINEGKMHACGHDFHTSSLLATAKLLVDVRKYIKGKVKLIFQPSEEKLPGGASVMIKENVLSDVDVIIGQHAMPTIDVGKVGIKPGKFMASSDEIYIEITGKGGHGAQPHTTVDPVSISANAITFAQQIVSRKADPRIPSVLSFGKIIANGATNIIPEKVYIEGTFRTFDEKWREKAHTLIKDVFENTAKSFGAIASVSIKKGYPVLINDVKTSEFVKKAMQLFLGEENVLDLELWMASEDFAYYTHIIPGVFYRTGIRNVEKNITSHLHTPTFDIDEDVLKFAPALMAFIAIFLSQKY